MYRSSIARPTGSSVYASPHTSRCIAQDSRPGWSRCLLSCRAPASPTTCRFIPALSVSPVIREHAKTLSDVGSLTTSPRERAFLVRERARRPVRIEEREAHGLTCGLLDG